MTLSRFAFGFAFVTGSLLAVGACGDDGGSNPVDARPDTAGSGSDGSIDTPPDARVVDFGSNEGGEVRLEWIKFPPNMTQANPVGARGTAFFYKDSGTTKFWPFLSLDGCTDLSGTNGNGKWPKAQNADRTYYDVGPYVAVTGGTSPFTINKNTTGTPAKDPVGRTETANNWYFDNATNQDTDGDTFLPSDTFFDVTLPGSATYAGTSYSNAIYMPGDMTPATPTWDANAIPATAGQPKDFVFNNATSHPPMGPDGTPLEIQNLIAFTGANGPAVICIKPQAAGDTTTVTVPAAMIDIVRTAYPSGGTLARQTVAHNVKEFVDETGAPTGRRIDFLGVWCYAGQGFTVPAAP